MRCLDAADDLVLLLVVVEDGLQARTLSARLLLELVVDDRPAVHESMVDWTLDTVPYSQQYSLRYCNVHHPLQGTVKSKCYRSLTG